MYIKLFLILAGSGLALLLLGSAVLASERAEPQAVIQPTPDQVRPQSCQYYPNGLLKHCQLEEDFEFHGLVIPSKSILFFHREGWLAQCYFHRNLEVNCCPCNGGFGKHITTRFHPNGSLASCFLTRKTMIQGYPCKKTHQQSNPTRFHPGGELHRFTLSTEFTIEGTIYPRGTRITLDEQGKLVSAGE